MNFESLLKQVGDRGRFQAFLLWGFLVPVSFALFFTEFLFMLHTPDHWCYVPELANESYEVQNELIRPRRLEHGSEVLDSCHRYDLDYRQVARTLKLPANFNHSRIVRCDKGWFYDQSQVWETAATKFDFVCDDKIFANMYLSLGALGGVLGSPIFSYLSDKYGRRKTYVRVMFLMLASYIAAMLFQDKYSFVLLRMVCNSFYNVFYDVAFILVNEYSAASERAKINYISCFAISVGGIFLPFAVYLTKTLTYFIALQLIIPISCFILLRWVPESASWLILQERYDEANAIMHKVAKMNGKRPPQDLTVDVKNNHNKNTADVGETTNDRSLDLLCVPELRRIFLILTFNILANVIAYNGLGLNSLNFHKSALVNFALLCLTDLPAITLGRYLVDSYPGRRWTNAGGLFVCGVVLCATVLIPSSATTALMAISIVGKFGTAVSYMVIYQQAAELYPTTLRTQGLTINATFGSFSNLCIPFITYLGNFGVWIPLCIMGSLALLASFTATFLPETLNRNMPQTVADVKQLQNSGYFSLAPIKDKPIVERNNV